MEQKRLRELEEQCIQGCMPPCTSYCPVHVDVRQIVQAIDQGDFKTAYKVFHKPVPFPEIIARICDQPCQMHCYRKDAGGAICVADLERACVKYGSEEQSKITVLPRKNAKVAVIGGGLSGMTAALELSKKGYQVSLFDAQSRLGGRLWQISEERLPLEVINRETQILEQTGIELFLGEETSLSRIEDRKFDAIYIGTGTNKLGDIEVHPEKIDKITFQTEMAGFFAGGSLLHPSSPILSISDGRRAAISIDRFLQNVSLTASRVDEGAYSTRLITNTSSVKPQSPINPIDQETGFDTGEAKKEAGRCLQCECMECVKACEYLRHYGSYPKKYVREIYNNLSIIMRTRTANPLINSCTLCGLCGEICPTNLDMGEVNRETRQTMVNTSKMPVSAHDFALRDMEFSNSARFAGIFLPDGKDSCQDLFFPGCQLAASNPEYVSLIYKSLSTVLSSLGVMLGCCGAPADWSGEKERFEKMIEGFESQWEKAGKPRLVLACSSCHSVFSKYLPKIETISIWELFEKYSLYPKGRNSGREYVIHDPCTSRYEEAWQNSARAGLTAMGVPFHELKMSRKLTECCGYGGVAWLANPDLVKDIIKRRVNEDQADYLTYCVMCRDLFAAEGKPTLHLLDLVYGKEPENLAVRRRLDYSQRHENRIRVKQQMEKLFHGKDQFELESFEKFTVEISTEINVLLEARLILVEDIQKVIEYAETSGNKFISKKTGHALAYFKPNLITYWVEYSPKGTSFLIHDAYSHRMEFEGESNL